MGDLVNVKGLDEVYKRMQTLTPKLEANAMRGALRAGMKIIQAEAKANAPKDTGEMAEGLKISTSSRGGRVAASLKAKGKHGYLANFVEFGTAAHRIPGPLKFNGVWLWGVDHPGARPHPFMRPALDARAQDAVVAVGEYLKARLASKHGLDTAHIMIEGDE